MTWFTQAAKGPACLITGVVTFWIMWAGAVCNCSTAAMTSLQPITHCMHLVFASSANGFCRHHITILTELSWTHHLTCLFINVCVCVLLIFTQICCLLLKPGQTTRHWSSFFNLISIYCDHFIKCVFLALFRLMSYDVCKPLMEAGVPYQDYNTFLVYI